MSTGKQEIKQLIDIDKMRQQIKMDLAQEHNWDKQQQHWESMQNHYKSQRAYLIGVGILGFIAVTVNGLAAFFAK